jgi:hypothetical protein
MKTITDIRREVRKHGGRLERDGCGGYEALAPDGFIWADAEVWCYPLPLNEAESREERQDMLEQAVRMLGGGINVAR